MNRDKIEQWILLRQAGELGPWRTRRLERLLARDPALRAFAADAEHLTHTARAWSVAQPRPHTAEAIHARIHAPVDRTEEWVFQPTHRAIRWPALAGVAALALVALGLWFRPPTEPARVADAGEMELTLDAWMDEELEALQDIVAWVYGTGENGATVMDDEEKLIRELLALEGQAI
ncbi:MAG TPA: hypothetical protein PKE12_01080 [Kiritimatiellia bacterium]|nr:hypothetical protein [Kiritimatiellia bacterium]